MKTKHLFLGISLFALIFASCSNSEVYEDLAASKAASFRISTGKTTRSVDEVGTNAKLQTEYGAGINVYYKASNGDQGYTTLVWDGTIWKPTTPLVLANGVTYSFRSVLGLDTPFDGSDSFTYNIIPDNTIQYKDVLSAATTVVGSKLTSPTININYSHPLSQLEVRVRYGASGKGTSATVTNVMIKDVSTNATYSEGIWTLSPDLNDLLFDSATDSKTINGTTIFGPALIIPQILTSISFTWSINGLPDGDIEGTITDAPLNLSLIEGKRNVIIIDITDPVTPTWILKVEDWTNNPITTVPNQ